ncbi:phosphopantetheine-binding protein [Actinoplanes sp. SE50]|uniref:phosphopantetheine-binding protein n=1 Tax=unclassified Actinoplanes TaxID=2626549 RepID=UPI00023EC174|nr:MULTISPECIES: phosphopantetheine-binding protein [unclassified Actinoplanes]AEV86968.1 phosphopantetheine-binding protein [Actinoplanes sp. SE50/110]ATO85364.1 phosphopantetheine-binding protein [Actinoplanes sp. SE50]SLM02776.1 phosphopantetheine-binding protein [Actinoplanes sp. SE50/110]
MWDVKFEEMVRHCLPFLPSGEQLEADADLRDLGLDSLGTVELLSALEKGYQVRFTDEMLSMDTFATPRTLWGALSGIVPTAV